MRLKSFSAVLALLFSISFYSCSKQDDAITTPPPVTTGSLLIWTDNPDRFTDCGPSLIIKLNTGQQSIISNYYSTAPVSCSDRLGGYFVLNPGTYTYTVTTIGACTEVTGTVTVKAGTCNLSKIL